MKLYEFEKFERLARKWIKQADDDLEASQSEINPFRYARSTGLINARQEDTEELINILQEMEVEI